MVEILQDAMDSLMKGRTVLVIAHIENDTEIFVSA
jgi:ABC-type multidrug transport system fused ATPase/permease subunit